MEKEIIRRIISQKDSDALCSLDEYDMTEILIELTYQHYYNMPEEDLNEEQKTIFLCMALEDHVQADGILSLTDEEELFFLLPDMRKALLKLGAPRTAEALQGFMDLMPAGTFENRVMPAWKWFFETRERENKISQIDTFIGGCPDGVMRKIYRRYITADETIAEELLDL